MILVIIDIPFKALTFWTIKIFVHICLIFNIQSTEQTLQGLSYSSGESSGASTQRYVVVVVRRRCYWYMEVPRRIASNSVVAATYGIAVRIEAGREVAVAS